jgi:hypothetical protein
MDGVGGFERCKSEAAGKVVPYSSCGQVRRDRDGAARQRSLIHIAEEQIGIGYRRLGAAEAITRRPRFCARAPRADA